MRQIPLLIHLAKFGIIFASSCGEGLSSLHSGLKVNPCIEAHPDREHNLNLSHAPVPPNKFVRIWSRASENSSEEKSRIKDRNSLTPFEKQNQTKTTQENLIHMHLANLSSNRPGFFEEDVFVKS